jgi:hypothetical protein
LKEECAQRRVCKTSRYLAGKRDRVAETQWRMRALTLPLRASSSLTSKNVEHQSTTSQLHPHIATYTPLSTSHRSRVDTLPPPARPNPPSRRVNTRQRWITMQKAAQSTCASCRYTARFVNWQARRDGVTNAASYRPTTSAPSSSSRISTSRPPTRCGG